MAKSSDVTELQNTVSLMDSICDEHCSAIDAITDCALKAMELPDFFSNALLIEKLFVAINQHCESMRAAIHDEAMMRGCEFEDVASKKRFTAICASTIFKGPRNV